MCRLFGFRSVIPSQVHRSLVAADNAILHQSSVHSDGWGVAYYIGDAPHVIKSTSSAIEDRLFHRVSGIVAAETVVAHIRKATQGEICVTNVHPFQFGRWVFMHNGNIRDFSAHRERLLAEIPPKMRRWILGQTDSELLFLLLLSKLSRRVDLERSGCRLDDLAAAASETVALVTEIVGPMNEDENGPPNLTYLSFIVTNGRTLLAHQGGKSLYYSTYKTKCSERGVCPCFAEECEAPSATGYVNHLLVSSEPIECENVWLKMAPGDMVGVDWNMRLQSYPKNFAV